MVRQGSLFSAGEAVGPRPSAPAPERTRLAGGAWVEFFPGWMAGADALFDVLVATVPWKSERRTMYERLVDVPRLLAFYGEGEPLPVPALDRARLALIDQYRGQAGGEFRTAGLCLYRDGRDSVAYHGDSIGPGAGDEPMVAILSLGAPRRLLLRPRGGGSALRFQPRGGDLLVMGGTCQRTWEHSVPKVARAGSRISVQYRPDGLR